MIQDTFTNRCAAEARPVAAIEKAETGEPQDAEGEPPLSGSAMREIARSLNRILRLGAALFYPVTEEDLATVLHIRAEPKTRRFVLTLLNTDPTQGEENGEVGIDGTSAPTFFFGRTRE